MRAATAAAGIALAVFLLFPRTSPFTLLVMAAPLGFLAVTAGFRWGDLGRPPMAVALIMAGYLAINSLWAEAPLDAAGKSALFLAIVLVAWLARIGLGHVSDAVLDRMVKALIAGFVMASIFLMLEEYTQHWAKRVIFNLLPFTRPDPKHIRAIDGEAVTDVYLYITNRNMAALAFSLWPVLLLLLRGKLIETPARRWLATGAVTVLAALTLAGSQHETSEIALALSVVAAVAATWWRRLAIALVVVGWIVSTLLVIPIVSHAYHAQKLYLNKSLPMSARHRVIIWGYTSELVPNAPLLGIGIESGKVRDARAQHEQPPDHEYPRRTGTHSHNVYVQTWYELGGFGAVLLCALGLSILVAIRRLSDSKQSFALATFVTAAAMAAFSWGMWQPWFMASFGASAVLFMIAAEHVRRAQRARGC